MEVFDSAYEDFTYTLVHESGSEKFTFCTFKENNEETKELQQLIDVFGNQDILTSISGGALHPITSVYEAAKKRDSLLNRTSLFGKKTGHSWKIYCTSFGAVGSVVDTFIGFVGLSCVEEDGLLLKPCIILKSEYQKKQLGPRVLSCLLAKLLEENVWFHSNIKGFVLEFHPENKACLRLIEKLLSTSLNEKKNPKRSSGTWVVDFNDPRSCKARFASVTKFLINSPAVLEMFFNTNVQRISESPRTLVLLSKGREKKQNNARDFTEKKVPVQKIEAGFQSFNYTFKHSRYEEKLIFRTYHDRLGPGTEILNLFNFYGNDAHMLAYSGKPAIVKSLNEAEKLRDSCRGKNSLVGNTASFVWQLFLNKGSEDEFMGQVRVRLKKDGQRSYLCPGILLIPKFQNKKYGTKVSTCVIHKLFSEKAWFYSMFNGVCVEMTPTNYGSKALKDSFLKNFDIEVKNSERTDGFWEDRSPWVDGKVRLQLQRKFILSSLQPLEAMLSTKFLSFM